MEFYHTYQDLNIHQHVHPVGQLTSLMMFHHKNNITSVMIIVMDENELHLLDVERRNLNILVQQILVVQMESRHFHHLTLMMKLIL